MQKTKKINGKTVSATGHLPHGKFLPVIPSSSKVHSILQVSDSNSQFLKITDWTFPTLITSSWKSQTEQVSNR